MPRLLPSGVNRPPRCLFLEGDVQHAHGPGPTETDSRLDPVEVRIVTGLQSAISLVRVEPVEYLAAAIRIIDILVSRSLLVLELGPSTAQAINDQVDARQGIV